MENINQLDFTQMLLDENHVENDSYYLLTPPASVTSPFIDYNSLNTPEHAGYNTEDIDDALLEALDPLLLNFDDDKSDDNITGGGVSGFTYSKESKSRQSPTLSESNFLNSLFCPKEIKKTKKSKPKTVSIGVQCSTSEMMFDKLRLQHPDIVPAPQIDTNFYYNLKGLVKNQVSVNSGDAIESIEGEKMKIKVTNLDYLNLKLNDPQNHHKLSDKQSTDGYLIPHTIVINHDAEKAKKESKKKQFLTEFSNRLTKILEDRYNKFKINVYKKRERNLQRNLNLAYNIRLIKSQCKSRYSQKYADVCQKKKQHPCHECYELFNTRNSLLTHMKLHRKPFCTTCLIFFQSDLIKNEHIKKCVSLPPSLSDTVVATTSKKITTKKAKVSISIKNNRKNNLKSNKTDLNYIKQLQPMVIIERLETVPLNNPHLPIKTEIFSPTNDGNYNETNDAILNITLKPLDGGKKYFMQYKYDFQAISNLTGKTITNEFGSNQVDDTNSYWHKNNNKTIYKTDDIQTTEPIQRKYVTRSGRTVNMYMDID